MGTATVLVIIFTLWLQCIVYGYEFISQYPNQLNEKFYLHHLAVDKDCGQVYAGSLNWIHQLSVDLKPIHVIRTGPKYDNPMCHVWGCATSSQEQASQIEDNANKILLVDQDSKKVIVCGSLHGSCSRHQLGDLSQFTVEPVAVAANDVDGSTYAFIGPEKYTLWDQSNVLYVATTSTDIDVPAISTRFLPTFDIAMLTFNKQSLIQISPAYRSNFPVKYVYGFNTSDYAYFLKIQKQSHVAGDEKLGYVSKIARICVSDLNYMSYTEVTLECYVNELNYNLVQDAKIAKAGAYLASQLGIEVGDSILVAVFSPSYSFYNKPLTKSAVCVYPLQEIDKKFIDNIQMCINGSISARNMDYMSPIVTDGLCLKADFLNTEKLSNFCNMALRINGLYPIKNRSLIHWNDALITSVTMSVTGLHTVAFLGTENGILKKILIDVNKSIEYSSEAILPGQTILSDTTLSPYQKSLYVLSSNSIVQIPTERCVDYDNCSFCLESKDPHCGWCTLEERCTVQSMCLRGTNESEPWWLSQYNDQQFNKCYNQPLPVVLPNNNILSNNKTTDAATQLLQIMIGNCTLRRKESSGALEWLCP